MVATVAWAVLLAGLTWWSVRHDPPTVREQRPLDQAGPVVDRAVGELVAAVGDGGVLALVPDRIARGCRITPMEDGAALERAVEVLISGDDVRGLLQRVADGLPANWRAGVRVTGDGPVLRADAGEFVAVEGHSTGSGRVRLTAGTGCRPVGAGYRAPTAGSGPEAAALAEARRALGLPVAPTPGLTAAPCPGGDGRTARTLRTTDAVPPVALGAALARLAAPAVVDTPEVYAYRSAGADVVVQRAGDGIRITAFGGCAT
nr:hypothetical protein [Micromonospora sp. RTP1Z1]